MNQLNDVEQAIKRRLENQSAGVLAKAQEAARCIVFLHLHGSTVQQVTVRPDYVVVDIDQPSDWLRGSIRITRVNGYHREIHMVAKVMDCQVQWVVREAHPMLRREG